MLNQYLRKFKKAVVFVLILSMILPLCGINTVAESKTNLVKGLSYTIEFGVDTSESFARIGNETDASAGLLTNGKYASSASYSDKAYHTFYRGLSRSVVFDLGKVMSVDGFSVSFLQDSAAGIDISDYVECYVSENGSDYMLAHREDLSSKLKYSGARKVKADASFDCVKARYVKIKFRVSVNSYIDEIEVYGGSVTGSERVFEKHTEEFSDEYEKPIDGCNDMVLLYCGYKGKYDESYVQNTEEEMLYYFGYCDKNGNISDTMFDSFMFSALGNTLPSGRSSAYGGDAPLKSDYEFYINSIFDEVYNCGAVEKAVEKVKTATGKSDYTVSLVINMPFPNISSSQKIGDFNGDGKDEYCKTYDDQIRIYDWFMNACIEKFNERGYKNIRLAGFYWESESISQSESVELKKLIAGVASLCHGKDCRFFWIPFLYANGFDYARGLGFDSIMMQPNLSFYDFTENMMESYCETIKKYNLGVEMEIHWNALNDSELLKKFYAYLNAGYKYGYMENASHSYYQNSNPGTFYYAAISASSTARKLYDDVYRFIKHTYKPEVPVLSMKSKKTIISGEDFYGYISGLKTGYTMELAESTSHGEIKLSSSGDFTYTSDEGYIGLDSFKVKAVSDYLESEVYEITLPVVKSKDMPVVIGAKAGSKAALGKD